MKQTKKRLTDPVTLFVVVEADQHEALRSLAFKAHRSLADVVRQALTEFLARQAEANAGEGDGAEGPEDPEGRVYYTPFHVRTEKEEPKGASGT